MHTTPEHKDNMETETMTHTILYMGNDCAHKKILTEYLWS